MPDRKPEEATANIVRGPILQLCSSSIHEMVISLARTQTNTQTYTGIRMTALQWGRGMHRGEFVRVTGLAATGRGSGERQVGAARDRPLAR